MTEQQAQRHYQGFGTVEGELIGTPQESRLLIGASEFPVLGWVPVSVQRTYQPGTRQRFDVYPGAVGGKVGFRILRLTQRAELGLQLNGCWEERQGVPLLVVYRNRMPYKADLPLRVLVPLDWENAPPADWQFWELRAEVVGDQLRVVSATGPFEPPRPGWQDRPPHSAVPPVKPRATRDRPAAVSPVPLPTSPLTPEEIRAMAIPAKVQLTCRINQMPEHRQLENQQIEFFLDAGQSKILTVRLKPKQFKKLTTHGYEQWVATVTGEIGAATATGFELENAAVQVFERKAADPTEGTAPPTAEKAPPAPAPAAPAAPVSPPPRNVAMQSSQRRNPLDGVQIR